MADTELATKAVKGPAIGLIATGVIGILYQVIGLVWNAAMPTMDSLPAGWEWLETLTSGPVAWILTLLSFAVSGLTVYGGMQLMKLQSKGLCLAVSIVAMIPCLGCCLLGLPIGIWAIVVMNKPEVKEAFS